MHFDLSSQESGRGTEDERRERMRSAVGVMLLLLEVVGPMLVLGLVVLSVLVSL